MLMERRQALYDSIRMREGELFDAKPLWGHVSTSVS